MVKTMLFKFIKNFRSSNTQSRIAIPLFSDSELGLLIEGAETQRDVAEDNKEYLTVFTWKQIISKLKKYATSTT